MEKFCITNKYCYIALNNIEVESKSFKIIEKYISVGLLLDLVNNGVIVENNELYKLNNDLELTLFEKELVKVLGLDEKQLTFKELAKNTQNIKQKIREQIVSEVITNNINSGNIDVVNSLLNLDVNYETSGLEIKEYRTSYEVYKETVLSVKDAKESNEYYSFIWLLLQSGDITKIFTYDEIGDIEKRYLEFSNKSNLVVKLAEESNLQPLLVEWKKCLEAKNTVFKKGFGLGLVSRFPILERKEAVFIATEKMFSSSQESLKTVMGKLIDNGHMVTVVREGQAPLIDVDNVLYELVPDAVRVKVLNIHGVRLRRYILK